MTDRKLMQMALDALESWQKTCLDCGRSSEELGMASKPLQALRERLAQPEPEPVAWMEDSRGNKYEIPEANKGYLLKAMENGVMPDDLIEAYERGFSDGKAKREWVGLTDEEIYDYADKFLYQHGSNYGIKSFGNAIEAKLKEKNT